MNKVPLLLAAGLALAACGNGGGRKHSTTGSSWTLLIYMVADNNLEPFGLYDLAEMAEVGSTNEFKIVVQSDRAAGYSSDGVGSLSDWESTKRLLVQAGSFEEIADLGEQNMGDPNTLAEFLRWGVESYPADRVGLIFWNHGAAWPGFGGDESTPDHDLLTLAELKSGIQAGMQDAGLDQFALIGFDACLMATYETALVLEPFGEYLLASEELEPGHGWDYSKLQGVQADPTAPPDRLGLDLMSGFEQQAYAEGTSSDITLSLIDLYELGVLKQAVGSVTGTVGGKLSEKAAALGQQRAMVLEFAKMPDPSQSFHMIDLGDLVSRLGDADPDLAGLRSEMDAALARIIVNQVSGPATTRATGLSIYFPPHQAYYSSSYDAVEEAREWREFLKAFYQQGVLIAEPPVFTNPNKEADVFYEEGFYYVQGQLNPGSAINVAEVTLYFAQVMPDGETLVVLGDWPGYLESSGLATGTWDGSITTISQGLDQAYGYLSVTLEEEAVAATVPMGYQAPGSQDLELVLLVYILDPDTGQEMQTTFFLVTEAGPGELFPEPGSSIYPLLMVVNTTSGEAGWQVTSEQGFDPGQDLILGWEYLQAGEQAYMELNVWDFAGNNDFVYFLGPLL